MMGKSTGTSSGGQIDNDSVDERTREEQGGCVAPQGFRLHECQASAEGDGTDTGGEFGPLGRPLSGC